MDARNTIFSLLLAGAACSAPGVAPSLPAADPPTDQPEARAPEAPVSDTPESVQSEMQPKPQPIAIIDATTVEVEVASGSGYCETYSKTTSVEDAAADAGASVDPKCEVIDERDSAAVVATKRSPDGWKFGLVLFGEKVEHIALEVGAASVEPDDFRLLEFAINPSRATLRYVPGGSLKNEEIEAVCAIARSKRCEFFEVAR